jgi:hypothetical protein
MKFRQRLFGFLALVSLAWVCYGVYASTNAFSAVTQATVTPSGSLSAQDTAALRTAGAGIGAGIGLTVFLCTGGLPFIVFSLLSWRNGVGLTRERQHKEQIEALKGKGA